MLKDSSYSLTSSIEEPLPLSDTELDRLANVANKVVDAAGDIILRHWDNVVKVSDTNVSSWTSIADEAEKAMILLIKNLRPGHAVYGKKTGWNYCSGSDTPEFVWVLDAINGETGGLLPTFGTSIAVVHNGKPVYGCINNPITRIKTIGMKGKSTRNGDLVKTRAVEDKPYTDIKDPCSSNKDAKFAYERLKYKVGETFINGNCLAYTELAAGMLQVVVDCGVDPYDILAVIPIVEGAGGKITDWEGNQLSWQPSPALTIPKDGFKVVASADEKTCDWIVSELSW